MSALHDWITMLRTYARFWHKIKNLSIRILFIWIISRNQHGAGLPHHVKLNYGNGYLHVMTWLFTTQNMAHGWYVFSLLFVFNFSSGCKKCRHVKYKFKLTIENRDTSTEDLKKTWKKRDYLVQKEMNSLRSHSCRVVMSWGTQLYLLFHGVIARTSTKELRGYRFFRYHIEVSFKTS